MAMSDGRPEHALLEPKLQTSMLEMKMKVNWSTPCSTKTLSLSNSTSCIPKSKMKDDRFPPLQETISNLKALLMSTSLILFLVHQPLRFRWGTTVCTDQRRTWYEPSIASLENNRREWCDYLWHLNSHIIGCHFLFFYILTTRCDRDA